MTYKYHVAIEVLITSESPLDNDDVYFKEPTPSTDKFRVSQYQTMDIEKSEAWLK